MSEYSSRNSDKCPVCNHIISKSANFCVGCGQPNPFETRVELELVLNRIHNELIFINSFPIVDKCPSCRSSGRDYFCRTGSKFEERMARMNKIIDPLPYDFYKKTTISLGCSDYFILEPASVYSELLYIFKCPKCSSPYCSCCYECSCKSCNEYLPDASHALLTVNNFFGERLQQFEGRRLRVLPDYWVDKDYDDRKYPLLGQYKVIGIHTPKELIVKFKEIAARLLQNF